MRTHRYVGGHMLLKMIEQQEGGSVVEKIYRTIVVLASGALLAGCATEKNKIRAAGLLVINTVRQQGGIVLTVMRDDETVFQYAGDIELRKGEDGRGNGIIYFGEEVTQ